MSNDINDRGKGFYILISGFISVLIWGREKSHNGHPDQDLNPGPNEYETWVPLT